MRKPSVAIADELCDLMVGMRLESDNPRLAHYKRKEIMSSFTDRLEVTPLPSGIRWQLLKEFSYHVGDEDSEEIITVPKGFVTDFASIPKLFWSIIGGPWGRYGSAAVIHDYLYVVGCYTRKRSDEIFYEGMTVLKVPWWKRKVMYLAVRIGARIPWNRYRRKNP